MPRSDVLRRTTVLLVISNVISSCTATSRPSSSGSSPAASESVPAETPGGAPSLAGSFEVAADGRKLTIMCWGEGGPAVLFDAGSSDAGIARWKDSSITEALAADRMACTYDRAGLGASDAAPEHPRTLDEVVDDLHELIVAADVPTPLVMVGSSGGGFNVYHHAGRFPDDVAGLVLLDVPAGKADLPADEVPAWDSPENPEHVDYVAAERQMAVARLAVPAVPVTVVTASAGQSADPAEQRVWLDGSSRPTHTVLDGGHDIQYADPDGVLAAILDVLEAVKVP